MIGTGTSEKHRVCSKPAELPPPKQRKSEIDTNTRSRYVPREHLEQKSTRSRLMLPCSHIAAKTHWLTFAISRTKLSSTNDQDFGYLYDFPTNNVHVSCNIKHKIRKHRSSFELSTRNSFNTAEKLFDLHECPEKRIRSGDCSLRNTTSNFCHVWRLVGILYWVVALLWVSKWAPPLSSSNGFCSDVK